MIVGAPGAASDAGKAIIYEYDDSDSWNDIVGTDNPIEGTSTDKLGSAVAMNAAGNRVIVGAPGAASDAGKAIIYEYDDDSWKVVGTDIQNGQSISMNAGGNIVVIGDYKAGGSNKGEAEILHGM